MGVSKSYYTPPVIAKLMIDLVEGYLPTSVIDICVGSWNLLQQARVKWPFITGVGVDVDQTASEGRPLSWEFYHMDARQFALNALVNGIRYSLVLGNPPFGREYEDVHSRYRGLPGLEVMSQVALGRIETTMLLANLALVRTGGYAALIVPRTVVDGEWAMSIRNFIGKNYILESVAYLPVGIFGRDIRTNILVIKKPDTSIVYKDTSVYKVSISGSCLQVKPWKRIPYRDVKKGDWVCSDGPIFEDNGLFQLFRGRVDSSNLVRQGLKPVIHSTDVVSIKSGQWMPSRFTNEEASDSGLNCMDGDIIMIRVGRNCGLAARIHEVGCFPFSNCVLSIRPANTDTGEHIWKIVTSDSFALDVSQFAKGIGARYITSAGLKNYLQNRMFLEEGRR